MRFGVLYGSFFINNYVIWLHQGLVSHFEEADQMGHDHAPQAVLLSEKQAKKHVAIGHHSQRKHS